MEDLCTLAKLHKDDLSTYAVSMAVFAWALRDAYGSGTHLDRAAFHRAADLALTLFAEEKKRFESVDCPAPLLDAVYLKAFLPGNEPEDQMEAASKAIARRFHAEILRMLYREPTGSEATAVSCSTVQPAR